jgi:hypothetical protein
MLRLLTLVLIAFALILAPIQGAERALHSERNAAAMRNNANLAQKHQAQATETTQLPCSHTCNSGGGTIVAIGPAEAPALRPAAVAAVHYAPWTASFASLVSDPLADPPKSIA